MSYALAVWEGPPPANDEAAIATFEDLEDRFRSSDELGSPPIKVPPTPTIAAFVEALLARWPDIMEEGGEDSPWSDGPMMGNASGPIIVVGMTASGLRDGVPFVIEQARLFGLVCFDPEGPPFVLTEVDS